ncbi:hypothetical protein L7F22_056599 [Adiantum nelumboides]|nr:hypothetical protein [Adiantum nelumboides]
MLQHVRDYGSFDPNTIDQAIADFNTLGSNSEHTPINLQPVRQARMRSTHHIGPSALHPMTPSSPAAHTIEVAPLEESDEDPSDMMLESKMNDMVEAIFEAIDPTADDMKQEALCHIVLHGLVDVTFDHIDKKRVTFDSGVMAKFEQASRRRATDQNIVIAEMQYFGLLKEIINADYQSFTILIFDVQWFKVIMEGPNATVRRDVSRFIEVDSTKPWSDLRDTFVLPEHCKQVIFYPKPSDERWWYVIKVAPRGARIYENYNLITVADAEPIETKVAELPDIDMTMPEDDVEPIEIEVAEMPEDDIVDLNDIDFSLGGELTVDLEVGIELCQDAVENT